MQNSTEKQQAASKRGSKQNRQQKEGQFLPKDHGYQHYSESFHPKDNYVSASNSVIR